MIELSAWIVLDPDGRPIDWTLTAKRRTSIDFFICDHPSEKSTTWSRERRAGYRCVRLLCKEWGKKC